MEEYYTQQQAEEKCRVLRMKRNSDTQQAEAVYQKTINQLFETYTEEIKRLDSEIASTRKQINEVRFEMSQAWAQKEQERIERGEQRPCMGSVVLPYKVQISDLTERLESLKNDRKYTQQHYEHNRSVAVSIRNNATRNAKDEFETERMNVMAKVATKQPDYWKQKYEALKKQMEDVA